MIFLVAILCAYLIRDFLLTHWLHGSLATAQFAPTWKFVAAEVLGDLPVTAAALALLPATALQSFRDLGLRRLIRNDTMPILLGIAMLILVFFALSVNVTGTGRMFGHASPLLSAALAAWIIVLSPFMEELVFRGFVFNAIRRYVPLPLTIVFDGVIFSTAHGTPNEFIWLTCYGTILACVYARTKSLVASTITHGTFNAFVIIAAIAGR